MSPSSPSNNTLTAIHGYDYDPVLNRFFKSSSSSNNIISSHGTSAQSSNTSYPQSGGPPLHKSPAQSTLLSKRPDFDPEIDPPSISNRSKHNARIHYREVCSGSTKPIPLTASNHGIPSVGEISSMIITPSQVGQSPPLLLLGTTHAEGFMCKLSELIDCPRSLKWEPINVVKPESDVVPITSIAYRPEALCVGTTAGCTIMSLRPKPIRAVPSYTNFPSMGFQCYLPLTVRCLRFTSRLLLIGNERACTMVDFQTGMKIRDSPRGSVLDIETWGEFSSILGTRSGSVIQRDVRALIDSSKKKLRAARSIFKLKLIGDNQLLIIGASSYAKVHDIRYLTPDPIISLDDWENSGDQTFGFTVSQDNTFVCMASRDQSIKIWDLKSNPNPGFGLTPIVTHHASRSVQSVLFIDASQLESLSPCHTVNRLTQDIIKKPSGPGILFGQGNAVHWLGATTS